MSLKRHLCLPVALGAAVVMACASCAKLDTAGATASSSTKPETKAGAQLIKAPMDLSFLLSMSFVEAKSISTQQLEFPPHLKIAADSIEVFKYTADGKPRKARARGKVFIEMDFSEPVKALCQEAFITEDEVILRGSPILQRGGSMVEGLDESTIFYLFGSSLRVIGLHRVNNQSAVASVLPALGTWAQGPNPLLPPLTESDVPSSIRDAMQRAAEAEMLHQKTRELYGPATPTPADSPPETPPQKAPDKVKQAPQPTTVQSKKTTVEIRRAVPSKPSFWSRLRRDKSRA